GLDVRVEDRRIERGPRATRVRCGRVATLLRAEDEVAGTWDVEQIVAGVRVLVRIAAEQNRVRTAALRVVEETERVRQRTGRQVVRRIEREAIPDLERRGAQVRMENVALVCWKRQLEIARLEVPSNADSAFWC